jgi:hypothetical protein
MTPDSIISRNKSFPSRVRSPTPAKTEIPSYPFGDVVDQFHDQNRLANTCTSKQSNLSSFGIGLNQVNDLNACEKYLGRCRQIFKPRSILVDLTSFSMSVIPPMPSMASPTTLKSRPLICFPVGIVMPFPSEEPPFRGKSFR